MNAIPQATSRPAFVLAAVLLAAACSGARERAGQQALRYVDPFIGTAAHGHTYPGATLPFGMVQLSPDNGTSGWDWVSGYHRPDSMLVGFSHTHLSGTGIGDLADILFLPLVADADPVRQRASRDSGQLHARFRHDDETASPGYYSVRLAEGVQVELTATTRTGWHRYRYPADVAPRVLIDLGFAINWDQPTASSIAVHGDTLVTGYRYSKGWAADQRVWFAARFSRPIASFALAHDSTSPPGDSAGGTRARAVLRFAADAEPLLAKVGISYVDGAGALRNLAAEAPGWDFDAVRRAASEAWAAELGSIRIDTQDVALARTFYTALYHARLAPIRFDDVDRRYRGGDGQVHTAAGFDHYSIFSLWDTFRAAHPLYTIIDPERVDDMVNSMLAFQREHGLLPVWSLVGNETNTMTGYHAIPVIADAWLKGIRGFDGQAALNAMIESATQDARGLDHYRRYGYVPSELEVESVTKTLEYAYDDWAIARMAEALGREQDAARFRQRATSWINVFDPETRFMRGRRADSTWVTPFDPRFASHREHTDFTEGNAWQHTWFVPHDVPGLIERMGGNAAFVAKLDSLFASDTVLVGQNVSPDISGLIGQYAHGNEPSHHIAYLYSYAGQPEKTAERVRHIMATLYDDTPAGLAGNEDCGQMSAWYVFSALGFYPVDPVGGVYVLGAPLFRNAEIDVGGGRVFRVTAAAGAAASYRLNGETLVEPWIRHEDIMRGGTLEVVRR